MNPICTCGEIMVREVTAEMVWDWVPGSPEIRLLFRLAGDGHTWLWSCHGCGFFCPGLEGNRRRASAEGRQ